MGPTGLRAANTEHPVFPVQIVQSQAADFPGPHGRAYRLLVLGSRAHVLAVRRLLARVKRRAER